MRVLHVGVVSLAELFKSKESVLQKKEGSHLLHAVIQAIFSSTWIALTMPMG